MGKLKRCRLKGAAIRHVKKGDVVVGDARKVRRPMRHQHRAAFLAHRKKQTARAAFVRSSPMGRAAHVRSKGDPPAMAAPQSAVAATFRRHSGGSRWRRPMRRISRSISTHFLGKRSSFPRTRPRHGQPATPSTPQRASVWHLDEQSNLTSEKRTMCEAIMSFAKTANRLFLERLSSLRAAR